MPHTRELVRMVRVVVPLVGSGRPFVVEFVSHCLPRLTAVVRALNHLPKPAARLGRVKAVRVCGRTVDVVHLPPRKVRSSDLPALTPFVRSKEKSTLSGSDQ